MNIQVLGTQVNSMKELIKFLNCALYYCEELQIQDPITKDFHPYSSMDESELEAITDSAKEYEFNELTVVQQYE